MLFHLLAQTTVQNALFDAKSIWDRIDFASTIVTGKGSIVEWEEWENLPVNRPQY